nr:MAG TPA: hypothetical protein [Caudoviricetes sp.]
MCVIARSLLKLLYGVGVYRSATRWKIPPDSVLAHPPHGSAQEESI